MAEMELRAAPAIADMRSGPGDAIVELAPQRSLASIALYAEGAKNLLDALGGALPLPGRQLQANGVRYVWSGPASWLALSNADDPDFCVALAQRLSGSAAVTDQSDGRCILRVHGPASRDALAKLLPIDLHPGVFAADSTALTLAGHINVQIWQDGENGFELACFRSFAGALFEALAGACREFQTSIADRG